MGGAPKLYRVLVPQDFLEAFYVQVASEEEAIDLVGGRADYAKEGRAELHWHKPQFLRGWPTDRSDAQLVE